MDPTLALVSFSNVLFDHLLARLDICRTFTIPWLCTISPYCWWKECNSLRQFFWRTLIIIHKLEHVGLAVIRSVKVHPFFLDFFTWYRIEVFQIFLRKRRLFQCIMTSLSFVILTGIEPFLRILSIVSWWHLSSKIVNQLVFASQICTLGVWLDTYCRFQRTYRTLSFHVIHLILTKCLSLLNRFILNYVWVRSGWPCFVSLEVLHAAELWIKNV